MPIALFFLFITTATTQIYTLSLHDALPISLDRGRVVSRDELLQKLWGRRESHRDRTVDVFVRRRSEEHTSELQSRFDLVCRLLLEKKKSETPLRGGYAVALKELHVSYITSF